MAVVVMHPPCSAALEQLARRGRWQIIGGGSIPELIRAVRCGGVRVLVIQVPSAAGEKQAVELIQRLNAYWIKVVLIAVFTQWRAPLEQALRGAGAMCYVADPAELDGMQAMVDQQCRRHAGQVSFSVRSGGSAGGRR